MQRATKALIPVVVGTALWFVPAPENVEPTAMHLLAVFIATIVGIMFKPMPMGAVAFVGICATALTGFS